MGESDTSKVKTLCPSCSQKLAVPANASGRRVKYPACSSSFTIPQQKDDPPAPERQFAVQREAEQACPNCGRTLKADVVLCIACGTDTRTGQKIRPATDSKPAPPKREWSKGRPFWVGCIGSGIGATIGTAVWVAFAIHTKHELYVLSIFMGGLSGLGMYWGHKSSTVAGGAVAAVYALAGLVIGRLISLNALYKIDETKAEQLLGIFQSIGVWEIICGGAAISLAYAAAIYGTAALEDD